MPFSIPFLTHWANCRAKKQEQKGRIQALDPKYRLLATQEDKAILDKPISRLVEDIASGLYSSDRVLLAYSRKALTAQSKTNCLTEIMIADAQNRCEKHALSGPLAGIPVSLKDMCSVEGWDSSVGYSAWADRPVLRNSAIVQLLLDAGAVPFVKTNIPITLLSFESSSDLFGPALNPHSPAFSPGGSSGGEAALLALGGSRIGIGTDVAGSVRVPAHYSGIYSIKSSFGRVPRFGTTSSTPGQEGVPSVHSPMARTLEDLEYFWKAIVSMKPWNYDPHCIMMPWREASNLAEEKLKFGVLFDDGVVEPSPACSRALHMVNDVLKKRGHEVRSISPPSPSIALKVGAQLLTADAAKTVLRPMSFGESNDPGVAQLSIVFSLPHWIRKVWSWYYRFLLRDPLYADLIDGCYEKTISQYWSLIAQRELYRFHWHEFWKQEELDFVITVPNALPAVPHGGMKEGFKACGYTFLFNLLDYTAGVLPVTKVDRDVDGLQLHGRAKFRNAIECGAYKMYDAEAMHGLPVGVQIVGRRLEEERVLEGMKLVERYLREDGIVYEHLPM